MSAFISGTTCPNAITIPSRPSGRRRTPSQSAQARHEADRTAGKAESHHTHARGLARRSTDFSSGSSTTTLSAGPGPDQYMSGTPAPPDDMVPGAAGHVTDPPSRAQDGRHQH